MQFTNNLIEVLRNYSIINSSILFKPGNIVSTRSKELNIVSMAKVNVEIPVEFAIYDLNEFLGILSILNEPKAEFTKNQVILKDDNKTVKYTFTNVDSIISSPYKRIDISPNDVITQFYFSSSDFDNILKACSILKSKDVTIEGDSDTGEINIIAGNYKDKTSSSYIIGTKNINDEITTNFRRVFNIDNLKLIKRNYVTTIPTSKLLQFESDDKAIVYWVAPANAE